jgi:hypothetical protein
MTMEVFVVKKDRSYLMLECKVVLSCMHVNVWFPRVLTAPCVVLHSHVASHPDEIMSE